MTVTSFPVRDEYTASAGQTVFNYTFKIYAVGDLNVYITPTGQTASDSTDIITTYTIDPATIGNSNGGLITLDSGAAAGDLVTIVSDIPDDRTTDYQNSGDFLPDTVNDDFDRTVSLVKQQEDRAGRTLAFEESQQNASSLTLPNPEAGLYLAWNGAESGLVNVGAPSTIQPSELNGTTAQMVADASLVAGEFILTSGYNTNGDGGGNIFLSRAVTGGTADGGTLIKGVGNVAIEFVGLFPDGIYHVEQFGATGTADDVTFIQAALDHCRDSGKKITSSTETHVCSTALTCISTNTSPKNYVIDFQGAILDFSASGLTSGELLTIGADSQAHAHDQEAIVLRNVKIVGPEGALNAAPTAPDGSTTGLFLEFCLNVTVENVNIRRCFEGMKTNNTWPLLANAVRVRECYVPIRLDDNSTLGQWNACEAVDSRYSVLVQPTSASNTISNQTFINFRAEGCDVGPVLDPLSGGGIGCDAINFISPYYEGITYDYNRHGTAFTLSTPATRGADRTREVHNSNILGGLWSHSGTWLSAIATRAPIAFPTTAIVYGGTYQIPAQFDTEIVGIVRKFRYSTLIDSSVGSSGNYEEVSSDVGMVRFVGATGVITQRSGNIPLASVTRVSPGLYDIVPTEPYNGESGVIVMGSCDGGVVICDSVNTTGSSIRIQCYNISNPQVVFDPVTVRIQIDGVIA